ncbi:MAG: ComEA family DNA-binding protein [Bacteroidota bacterium]
MENPLEFSKRSRRATLLFVLCFLIIVLIPRVLGLFASPPKLSFTQTDFEKKQFSRREYKSDRNYSFRHKKGFQTPPAKFDPNQYAPSDWMNLGLSQKQADLIIRFGKRGFYSHEDLRKVFVISDRFFDVIKDSLVYPERPARPAVKDEDVQYERIVEINTASLEELMSLQGIGEFFAKNIIKTRNALGGFVTKQQLLEVWKFDTEKLAQIEEKIEVNPKNIRQIDINTATAEELKVHPYIKWNVANSIVKMRDQLGGYQKIEDIRRSVLIDEALFLKLKPYLTL